MTRKKDGRLLEWAQEVFPNRVVGVFPSRAPCDRLVGRCLSKLMRNGRWKNSPVSVIKEGVNPVQHECVSYFGPVRKTAMRGLPSTNR